MRSGLCLWIRALKARPSFQLLDRKQMSWAESKAVIWHSWVFVSSTCPYRHFNQPFPKSVKISMSPVMFRCQTFHLFIMTLNLPELKLQRNSNSQKDHRKLWRTSNEKGLCCCFNSYVKKRTWIINIDSLPFVPSSNLILFHFHSLSRTVLQSSETWSSFPKGGDLSTQSTQSEFQDHSTALSSHLEFTS